MSAKLAEAEQVFVQRMLPHVLAGLSPEDAAKAVLDDDARIFRAFVDQSHQQYFPTPDEQGRAFTTRSGKGDLIVKELARSAYGRLRAAQEGSST